MVKRKQGPGKLILLLQWVSIWKFSLTAKRSKIDWMLSLLVHRVVEWKDEDKWKNKRLLAQFSLIQFLKAVLTSLKLPVNDRTTKTIESLNYIRGFELETLWMARMLYKNTKCWRKHVTREVWKIPTFLKHAFIRTKKDDIQKKKKKKVNSKYLAEWNTDRIEGKDWESTWWLTQKWSPSVQKMLN